MDFCLCLTFGGLILLLGRTILLPTFILCSCLSRSRWWWWSISFTGTSIRGPPPGAPPPAGSRRPGACPRGIPPGALGSTVDYTASIALVGWLLLFLRTRANLHTHRATCRTGRGVGCECDPDIALSSSVVCEMHLSLPQSHGRLL